VKLTSVKKDQPFELEMKTGFTGTPINQHYVNTRINGTWYNWNVPSPGSAIETGIRYGAYSVLSGEATIYVCNTSYTCVSK